MLVATGPADVVTVAISLVMVAVAVWFVSWPARRPRGSTR
jgi:hypothetical protein